MALTVQEDRTHNLIQQACKKYVENSNIDWEQREWEIFKMLCKDDLDDCTNALLECKIKESRHIVGFYKNFKR